MAIASRFVFVSDINRLAMLIARLAMSIAYRSVSDSNRLPNDKNRFINDVNRLCSDVNRYKRCQSLHQRYQSLSFSDANRFCVFDCRRCKLLSFIVCHIVEVFIQRSQSQPFGPRALRGLPGAMAAQLAMHLKAVATFLSQVKHTAHFEDVVAKQQEHFSRQVAPLKFSIADANEVMAAIQMGPWPERVAQALMAEVAAKTTESSHVGRVQNQDYKWMSNYLPSKLWSFLQDQTVHSNAKAEMLLQHGAKLGLKNPSEVTYQVLTAVLLACHEGLNKANSLIPSAKHENLLFVKSCFKRVMKSFVPTTFVQELPQDVREFESKFPVLYQRAFENEPPAPCALDAAALSTLTNSIPMRKTHKQMSTPSFSQLQPVGAAPDMGQFMQLMRLMLQQESPGNIPIQIFRPGASGSSSSSQGGNNIALPSTGRDELQVAYSPAALQLRGKAAKPAAAAPAAESEAEAEGTEAEADAAGAAATAAAAAAEATEAAAGAPAPKQPKLTYRGPKLTVEESLGLIQKQLAERPTAKAKTKGKAKGKAKGKGKAAPKTAAKVAKPKVKAAAAPDTKSPLLLGCGKCRGSAKGCVQCRDPSFKGARWQR